MTTATFIDQLAAGQAADAKETLSNLLSARAFEALDARKQELGATLFGGQVEEEVEELDELSKSTLGSYVKKAASDVNTKSRETQQYKDMFAGNYPVRGAKKEVAKKQTAIDKRVGGIGKAVDKMTK